MQRRRFLALAVAGSLPAVARGAGRGAIESAVRAVEPRVLRLTYFGGSAGALGAPSAPLTGFELGRGWVATSTYALEQAPAAILVRSADGEERPARLVARDFHRAVALLRVEGEDSADGPSGAPPLAGRAARVGETAVALGRVYSLDRANVSVGVVSAVGRFGGRAVQTDATLSPANYGGPLLGLDGAVLGLVVPLAPAGFEGVELYDSGVGFAAAVDQVAERLPTLARGIDIRPGRLGLRLVTGDPLTTPAQVLAARRGGPAAAAGVAMGDTVVRLAGRATPSVWALRAVVGGLDAGQTVECVVTRGADRSERTLRITLGEVLAKGDQAPTETKNPSER